MDIYKAGSKPTQKSSSDWFTGTVWQDPIVEAPEPAREVSMVYHQRKLKLHIIEALHDKIRAIIRGAIVYEDIKIISPK